MDGVNGTETELMTCLVNDERSVLDAFDDSINRLPLGKRFQGSQES